MRISPLQGVLNLLQLACERVNESVQPAFCLHPLQESFPGNGVNGLLLSATIGLNCQPYVDIDLSSRSMRCKL